nr:sterile alpha motif domain-containing protein 13 isoform X2 [Geotrypetes seraphini]
MLSVNMENKENGSLEVKNSEENGRPPDPADWAVVDVVNYFRCVGFEEQASAFQEQMQQVVKNLRKKNIQHWEMQLKFTLRLYVSPILAYRMGITQLHQCPKCTQAHALLGHMFWSCPRILQFWHRLGSYITSLWGWRWTPTPRALFGFYDIVFPKPKGLSAFKARAMLLGKKAILTQWLASDAPTYSQWKSLMIIHASLECRHFDTKPGQ